MPVKDRRKEEMPGKDRRKKGKRRKGI